MQPYRYLRFKHSPITYSDCFLFRIIKLLKFLLEMFWKGCLKIYFVWCVEPVKEMSIALDSIYSWCENFTSATSVICDAHNLQICILQQAKHIKWPQPILMQVAGAPHPLQSIMLRIIAISLCNSSKSNKRINNNGIYCTRDVLGIRINASIVTKTFFHESILGGLFIQRGHTMPYLSAL